MRRLPLTLALTLAMLGTTTAHAGGDIGVVVTGDPTMQPQLLAQIEGWLHGHGHELVASPLPPEATNKLIDCFVIEDTDCARKVVESQAKTATVVFARVEVTDSEGSGMRDVTITGYWFERGGEPVAERRSCEKCTEATMRRTGDDLMTALAGAGRTIVGQLHVTSTPTGARVTIDGTPSGVTPAELALPPGAHTVTVTADGHREAARTVTITKGETSELDVPLPTDDAGPRSRFPYLVIGAGGALAVTGIVLYATSETDTGDKFEYRDTRALGVGLAVSGLAVAGVGAYLWFKGGRADSAPAVAVVPGGGYLGWAGSF
jgi:hypothetical protein